MPVQGVHDLYLIFDGEGYEIKSWICQERCSR